MTFQNALISVANKEGLLNFVQSLSSQGLRVLSTGGTAKHLRDGEIQVIDVSEQTQFPEVMDGRVKTLHPNIHMGLLARDHVPEDLDLLKSYGLEPFDLVIGNLYPFEENLSKNLGDRDLCEFIDIGGPSFLRAAAKSYERIAVICDPNDYEWILEKGELTLEDRRFLAAKLFSHTASYDAMIASEMQNRDGSQKWFAMGGEEIKTLRYGENPQQKSTWYRRRGARGGLHDAKILQGKELSYNNLLDLEAATRSLRSFQSPAVVAVKHNNPCGVARDNEIAVATKRALKADPVSVFGGIVALNRAIDAASAESLSQIFLECIVAPEITAEAKEIFAKKKNLRVLEWKGLIESSQKVELKTIEGGFLVQDMDIAQGWQSSWEIIGEEPDEKTRENIAFAWSVVSHLKSNAIALTAEGQTVGLGMGQVNRVDAVKQSIERMREHHPEVKNVTLASDAFFPFADSIELAADAGIRWVIQPGGSLRDQEVIEKAKEHKINMVMTKMRHFRH